MPFFSFFFFYQAFVEPSSELAFLELELSCNSLAPFLEVYRCSAFFLSGARNAHPHPPVSLSWHSEALALQAIGRGSSGAVFGEHSQNQARGEPEDGGGEKSLRSLRRGSGNNERLGLLRGRSPRPGIEPGGTCSSLW